MSREPSRFIQLAEDRLAALEADDGDEPYADFFLEDERRELYDDIADETYRDDKPRLPHDLAGIGVDAGRPIRLPNRKYFFWCRTRTEHLRDLLQHPDFRSAYRGHTWPKLYHSDYKYVPYIFKVRGHRRALTGEFRKWGGRYTQLVPGDKVERAQIPGRWSGDPEVEIDVRDDLVPQEPGEDSAAEEVDPTHYHYFFINRFGVDLEGKAHLTLPGGASWWPAADFPEDEKVLEHFSRGESPESGPTPFTGVLLIPLDEGERGQARETSVQRCRERVVRVRVLADLLKNTPIGILGDARFKRDRKGRLSQVHRGGRREFLYAYSFPHEWVERSRYGPDMLVSLADVALVHSSRRSMLPDLHRALDSYALARALHERPIAHVLIWAAIETLISPGQEGELSTNMAITLLGLNQPVGDPEALFRETKASYGVRSKIVHAFSIPADKELEEAERFAIRQFRQLVKSAVTEGLPQNWSRQNFWLHLRSKALKSAGRPLPPPDED